MFHFPLPRAQAYLYKQSAVKRRSTEGRAETLGHSDVSATMNVYAHAAREAKRTSTGLLDKVAGNDLIHSEKSFPCELPIRSKTREST